MYNNQQFNPINQMKRCKKCGQLIPYNAKKCMYCGKSYDEGMILVWIFLGSFIVTFLIIIVALLISYNA